MKTLKNVSTEMALHVLAYNMKRVMSISGRWRTSGSDPGIRSASGDTWPRLPISNIRVFYTPGSKRKCARLRACPLYLRQRHREAAGHVRSCQVSDIAANPALDVKAASPSAEANVRASFFDRAR